MNEYSLINFYIVFNQWIKDGFPATERRFTRRHGLCTNLANYLEPVTLDQYRVMIAELSDSFHEVGLSANYPFNPNGTDEYIKESDSFTIYENKARLDWIAKHV